MRPKKGDWARMAGSWSGVYFNGRKWVRFACQMCARMDGLLVGGSRGHTDRTIEMCLGSLSDHPDRHRCGGTEKHKEFYRRKAAGEFDRRRTT